MKSILTGEKHKKTAQKGITLIALVVTIIVLLILAGVSIAMLTGQNGILRRAEEAGTNTAHAEVYEILNLQTVDYMTESKLGEYSGSLVDYLMKKGYIEKTDDEGKYKINVETLLGQKGKYGNGEGNTDVYKLEKANTVGKIIKLAKRPTAILPDASTVKNVGQTLYNVIYYGKKAEEKVELGKIKDSNSENLISFTITGDGQTKKYIAKAGSTWEEWISSEYNPKSAYEEGGSGWTIENGFIVLNHYSELCLHAKPDVDSKLKSTDTIQNGATYYLNEEYR